MTEPFSRALALLLISRAREWLLPERRASAAFDQINKYFTIARMPVVSSQYWNMVYGGNAEQARLDAEGMQTMRTLGRNMAWLLKCIKAGRDAGIDLPEQEKPVMTNFIR